jgi:heme/copper-type cytochrome/quinol oxidase subunit 2
MIRKLLPLLFVGITIFWLVVSYLPVEVVPWRVTANERFTPLFLIALIVSAFIFVAIQIVLVTSVFKFPQRVSRDEQNDADDTKTREIHIRRRWEFVWTVIPLLTSVILFVVSYCVLLG